jgi:para-aminobenzoate synthetase component I
VSSSNIPDLPLVERLAVEISPLDAFKQLAALAHVVFFDSALTSGKLGRYSFIAADPFEWIEAEVGDPDPLAKLATSLGTFQTTSRSDLPPFQGGIAGLFSYDLNASLERLPSPRIVDFPIPALAVGLYDVVLAFDHVEKQGWILSQGFPEQKPTARRQRAARRLEFFRNRLAKRDAPHCANSPTCFETENLAPQFATGLSEITSNMSAADYQRMVKQAVEYIRAGDVFQVNLAQRLLCPSRSHAVNLYRKLREKNPAPYAGFLDLGDWQLCSSSPECFLKVYDRRVETRPIKGTRGRSSSPEADLFVGDELQLSEKDRAENVMIVDLMRNDISQVCTADSVHVAELCGVETYAHVKHLVSSVRGILRDDVTNLDLLKACFPGGSITGAPKIRAMEIIAELEPTARGAYCGSLAYLGFNGQMDSSILIRTITAGAGWWQLPVGGGIVAQSQPLDEYRETWHKARGLLHALDLC